jgi:hypothetical protein
MMYVAQNMLSFCRLDIGLDDTSIQYADKNISNIKNVMNHDSRKL